MKTLTASFFLAFIFAFNIVVAQNNNSELNLMPYPQKLEMNHGRFLLGGNFSIGVKGEYTERVKKYAFNAMKRLAARTGIFFINNEIVDSADPRNVKLVIDAGRKGKLVENEDESYELVVNENGISITSVADIGCLRGLETLLQMLSADKEGYYFPSVRIEDFPRFTWRGLMIDAGRHFIPVDQIKRNLDAMSAVKMNVMHWHLSDDQGFRVECSTFPELYKMGSDGNYYTQEQIKDIINYASDRAIRVVPEFDIPGHSTSWFVSHPEYASAEGPYKIERKWGIFDPTFDPTKEEVYPFFDKFFAEISVLFPDEYIHIGGDENNGRQWLANEKIKKFMAENNFADPHALQGYFISRILKIVSKYNKKMMGWDNILRDDMPKNILMQSWQGVESLGRSAKKGFKSILSSDYYIDLIQPATRHYLNDPIPENSDLSADEKKLILGGEATMWSEFVNAETIDSRIWPRTAVIAERLWSAQSVKDVDNMYKRLEYISYLLEEHGLMHEKNYQVMLRRLSNNAEITPLKNFVDLVEPVKEYARNQQREHTQFSPLTRVVDAARPDQKTPRQFSALVDRYVSTKSASDAMGIEALLRQWKENQSMLNGIIDSSPVLNEIRPLSGELSKVAGIGLEILKFHSESRKPDQNWLKEKAEELEKAKKPCAQVELMIVTPVEKLLNTLKD